MSDKKDDGFWDQAKDEVEEAFDKAREVGGEAWEKLEKAGEIVAEKGEEAWEATGEAREALADRANEIRDVVVEKGSEAWEAVKRASDDEDQAASAQVGSEDETDEYRAYGSQGIESDPS